MKRIMIMVVIALIANSASAEIKRSPANMQWQTVADAKAKDKWERKECGK